MSRQAVPQAMLTVPKEKTSLAAVAFCPISTSGACNQSGHSGSSNVNKRHGWASKSAHIRAAVYARWARACRLAEAVWLRLRRRLRTSQRGLSRPPAELERTLSSRIFDRLKSQTCKKVRSAGGNSRRKAKAPHHSQVWLGLFGRPAGPCTVGTPNSYSKARLHLLQATPDLDPPRCVDQEVGGLEVAVEDGRVVGMKAQHALGSIQPLQAARRSRQQSGA